jgi:hypothetical protein
MASGTGGKPFGKRLTTAPTNAKDDSDAKTRY